MKDNCFTMLCWFLPYINMNQLYICICIYVYMTLPATPSHPSRLSQSPHLSSVESHSKVPLAVLFTYGSVCFHATLAIHPLHLSHPLLPWTPMPLHPHVCSLCLHLRCCPADRFISTILLGSLYICVYRQYLFFAFWITSLCIAGSRFIHLLRSASNAFSFMADIPLYICTTASLSIHLSWTSRLLSCPSYCK